jgi:N-acetylglutamate synthase-like GNAT family acetyltransferase
VKPGYAGIQPRHDITAQQIDALEERLYGFNASQTGYDDAALLAFLAEVGGELIGAVAGFTSGGVCELRQVSVHEAHRGYGLGGSLIRRAIQEARDRGCPFVFLATNDFQASAFCGKPGFTTVAEIRDKPVGQTDIMMRLSLRDE